MIKEHDFESILHCVKDLSPRQKERLSLKLSALMADTTSHHAYQLITQEELDLLAKSELAEEERS
ncbi:hypothetical protein [Vibrio hepatarius]|uniref:hypothetical protein n=1 Tax=Vibrio hepatarius TaxID=171383 RepID=UPI003736E60E